MSAGGARVAPFAVAAVAGTLALGGAASLAVAAPALADVAHAPQDMLRAVGPQSAHVLDLWRLALVVCSVVFAAVLAAFVWALWRAPRADAATPPDVGPMTEPEPGPRRGVIAGVAVSIALLLVLVGASVATDRALAHLALRDALHLEVTANQWWWSVRYDDADVSRVFDTANEIVVPVGRPVILTLHADDVIHTFWAPNIGGKKDLIPGRESTHSFRIDREGTYRGQCAEFCGAQHARMAFAVTAVSPEQYEAWASAQRQPAPEPGNATTRRGRAVFLGAGCPMCHAVQGTEAQGRRAPDLTHLASRATLAAGTLPNDREHLAGWISDPQAWKPGVNMPATAMSREDLTALVSWLGSLQ